MNIRKHFKIALVVVAAVAIAAQAFAGPLPKPMSSKPEAQKLIDQAWKLFRSDVSAESYKQCISLIEQADKLDPNNASILSDLSRYIWSYGDKLPKKTKEEQKVVIGLHARGIETAEKSLKVKETSGGHYWLAANKASSLEFSSIVSQAAAFPSIYKHAEFLKKNDPLYYYGATGRLWSEILSRVPKKTVEMVHWDVNEAVEDINKAIKAEPRYFDNYLYKARFMYVYFGNKDEALKLLDTILKQDPNVFPEEVIANRDSQKIGKAFWKTITGKDYPAK